MDAHLTLFAMCHLLNIGTGLLLMAGRGETSLKASPQAFCVYLFRVHFGSIRHFEVEIESRIRTVFRKHTTASFARLFFFSSAVFYLTKMSKMRKSEEKKKQSKALYATFVDHSTY